MLGSAHYSQKEKVRDREMMELKKVALVKVALLLFLLGFSATTADATRFDPRSFITQVLPNNYYVKIKSTATACCDLCLCTKSNPPQCQCVDGSETGCHSCCKNCICNKKFPRTCFCGDITNFCYDKCNSTEAN